MDCQEPLSVHAGRVGQSVGDSGAGGVTEGTAEIPEPEVEEAWGVGGGRGLEEGEEA